MKNIHALLILNLLWLCIFIGWEEHGITRLVSIHLRNPSDPVLSVSVPYFHFTLCKWWHPRGPRIRIGQWQFPGRPA
jgi:hypothetical protein